LKIADFSWIACDICKSEERFVRVIGMVINFLKTSLFR
jgi:hypothetical protein